MPLAREHGSGELEKGEHQQQQSHSQQAQVHAQQSQPHQVQQQQQQQAQHPTQHSRRVYPTVASEYTLREEVGQGGGAIVYKATCIPFNEVVAIKSLDLEKCNSSLEDIRKEAQIMGTISHPNLVRAYCSFAKDQFLWVVMPFMEGGSCLHIMKSHFPHGLEEPVIATILKETLKGLDYLHRHGHIHRDVKAGNILLDMHGNVKLADFGVSACMFDTGDRLLSRNTFVGTPCWMAPEVLEQHGYDFKADIWSFGITALELAHGHAPFDKYPPMKVLLMTLQGPSPGLDYERDKKFSKAFKEMIAMCLVKEPLKRPSADKLLKHVFFKQAKSPDYLAKHLLEGLPPLVDRVQQLKVKDEARLAAKKVPMNIQEQRSQEEYKLGVSGWNFNVEDLKKQAAILAGEQELPPSIPEDETAKTGDSQSASSGSTPVSTPASTRESQEDVVPQPTVSLSQLQLHNLQQQLVALSGDSQAMAAATSVLAAETHPDGRQGGPSTPTTLSAPTAAAAEGTTVGAVAAAIGAPDAAVAPASAVTHEESSAAPATALAAPGAMPLETASAAPGTPRVAAAGAGAAAAAMVVSLAGPMEDPGYHAVRTPQTDGHLAPPTSVPAGFSTAEAKLAHGGSSLLSVPSKHSVRGRFEVFEGDQDDEDGSIKENVRAKGGRGQHSTELDSRGMPLPSAEGTQGRGGPAGSGRGQDGAQRMGLAGAEPGAQLDRLAGALGPPELATQDGLGDREQRLGRSGAQGMAGIALDDAARRQALGHEPHGNGEQHIINEMMQRQILEQQPLQHQGPRFPDPHDPLGPYRGRTPPIPQDQVAFLAQQERGRRNAGGGYDESIEHLDHHSDSSTSSNYQRKGRFSVTAADVDAAEDSHGGHFDWQPVMPVPGPPAAMKVPLGMASASGLLNPSQAMALLPGGGGAGAIGVDVVGPTIGVGLLGPGGYLATQVALSAIMPHLNALVKHAAEQQDAVFSLMNCLTPGESALRGSFGSKDDSSRPSLASGDLGFEVPNERERELMQQVADLQSRLITLTEELGSVKNRNVQLERQLNVFYNKEEEERIRKEESARGEA